MDLVISQNFKPGIENPLLDKLEAAQNVLENINDHCAVVNILTDFILIVEKKKQISDEQEEDMVDLALNIIYLVNYDCPL